MSANFVTVFQLRAVVVTPRRLSDSAPTSFDSESPRGYQA
jgi:hypothetical protein